jgi:hypothetical protein
MSRKLDIDKTVDTIFHLKLRINDRFPESGLLKICEDLYEIGKRTRENIQFVNKPNWLLRITFILLISIFAPTLVFTFATFFKKNTIQNKSFYLSPEELESIIQILIFIGGSIYSLYKIEDNIKRKKALKHLYELKSIAHVIDMHQLIKEPISLNTNKTKNSPKRELSNFQLLRYLDYCCELLSLTSKISTLYSNELQDEVVLNTINEIEELTLGLTQKNWQKITLINEE